MRSTPRSRWAAGHCPPPTRRGACSGGTKWPGPDHVRRRPHPPGSLAPGRRAPARPDAGRAARARTDPATGAHEMTAPILVAVDPGRDDPAPLALGLRLARLAGAPLLLAATYPLQAADRVHPELLQAVRAGAEAAL